MEITVTITVWQVLENSEAVTSAVVRDLRFLLKGQADWRTFCIISAVFRGVTNKENTPDASTFTICSDKGLAPDHFQQKAKGKTESSVSHSFYL